MQAVSISVTRVLSAGVMFTVRDMHQKAIAELVTADEIVSNPDWIAVQYADYEFEAHGNATPKLGRETWEALKRSEKEWSDLQYEESLSTGERYKELSGPHGLTRMKRCEVEIRRLAAKAMVKEMFGVWPFEMRDSL